MGIEWESMEGYDPEMSAEAKLELLENYSGPASSAEPKAQVNETPKPEPNDEPAANRADHVHSKEATEKMISKRLFDKTASELAATKRQLRAKMSEEETREYERKQAQESMEQELAALRKEKTLSSHRAAFLSLGYADDLAHETAEALSDGDMDAVFANMKKHITGYEKMLRAQILKDTPTPPSGDKADVKEVDPFIEAFKKG